MRYFELVIATRGKIRVAVTPVNCLLWARENEQLRGIYNSANICTADGVPLIWASRFSGPPIRGRVTGLDLLPAFAEVAARKGYSFYFMGAGEGVADRLKGRLERQHPGLNVAGTYSPPYVKTFSLQQNKRMVEQINEVSPDVLWVSLTAPRQDYWIQEHFEQLNVRVAIGVGAAFDVVAGDVSRAPVWMQKNGLEWLYRLTREPGRLYKRYLVEAPRFVPLVTAQILRERIFIKKRGI